MTPAQLHYPIRRALNPFEFFISYVLPWFLHDKSLYTIYKFDINAIQENKQSKNDTPSLIYNFNDYADIGTGR
jgi:hypothetical protein